MTLNTTSRPFQTPIRSLRVRPTSLAGRLDRAGHRPAPASATCHYVGCTAPATDTRGGFRFCLGHLFAVMQWEQGS